MKMTGGGRRRGGQVDEDDRDGRGGGRGGGVVRGSEAERDGTEIKFPKQKRVRRSQHT